MVDYDLVQVSELTATETPANADVLPIQQGTELKKITFQNLKSAATGDVSAAISSEANTRATAVSNEATARTNADTALQAAITNEATTRGNADTAILADLASPYSASATYAVGDYCTKDGVLKRCNTAITTAEAWNSAHWDDAKLGGDVSTLRSALNDNFRDVIGTFEIPFSDFTKKQYIVTNGTTVQWETPSVSATTNIKWAVVECKAGDVFIINGKGGNSDRLWAFADSAQNILSNAESGASGTNLQITAPEESAYLIINNEQDKPCYYGLFKGDLNSLIITNTSDISTINTKLNTIFGWANAVFTANFKAEHLANGLKVSWSRLYVKRKTSYTDINTAKEYTLTDAQGILMLNSSGGINQISSITSVTNSDIVLLYYRDGKIVDGILYPTYNNYIALGRFKYADDSHLNVYRFVQQLANLKWTPKALVDSGEGQHPAGTEVTGVPYSSVKEYLKYVGIDVSIHTFMTAVNDEHSLLYTEYPLGGQSDSDYGRTYHGVNCKCYYGTVCSGLVTTAIGSIIQYNSWEFQTFPDVFDVLQNQDIKNLQVGDIMSYDGHCGVVTRIVRNADGSIGTLDFDEQSAPIHLGDGHTPFTLAERAVANSGIWCRYKGIENNTKYKPSTFVLSPAEFLYIVGDFVYIDGVNSRTYYLCKTANSDSQFTGSKWTTIPAFAVGQTYTSVPYSFVSHGDKLYQCKARHTATEFDETKWAEIKGVFEWAAYPYVYNNDIVTFAGDRAAFHSNDLIYINYSKGNYTKMQLYKDGTLIQTITLPNSGYQIDVSSYCANAGMYKARLTDETNYSRYTYFEVVDTDVSATYENGEVTIEFSSANGIPVEWQIVEQSGATVCHMALSAEEISAGKVVINPKAKMFAEKYVYPNRLTGYSNTIYARIMFAGEYGNVVNQMIELGTLVAVSGELVFPNEPKDIGIVSETTNVLLADRMHGNVYTFTFTGNGASVNVLPSVGQIKWVNEIPASPAQATTYLVTISNGIGNVAETT